MWYIASYVLCVVLVNYGFTVVPMVPLPGGEMWPPMALVVGFIFVLRDYAQRQVGHWILPAMLLGGVISWFMASPQVAMASVCAFLTGEFMDWAVYTYTGRPFSQRVLISSAVGTPVDSVVFLGMVGMLSLTSVVVMTLSKMVASFIIFLLARRRERAVTTA